MSLDQNAARHLTAAEAALLLNPSLNNTTAATPGKNAMDSGHASKSGLNPQPGNNLLYKAQTHQQNILPAVSQHVANEVQNLNSTITDGSQEEYDAQMFLAERTAQMVEANPSIGNRGQAIKALGAMDPKELRDTEKHIAATKVQTMGLA